jgi:hypothetical protein
MPAARWWRRGRTVELGYRSGSEFDPGDPFGLCLLSVRSDGAADLVNRRSGRELRYQAAVAPGVLDQVLACLHAGGFPAVPAHVVPAGPTR